MKRRLLYGAGIIILSLAVSCPVLQFQTNRIIVEASEALDSTWIVDDDSAGSSWDEAAAETEQTLQETETQAESTWVVDESSEEAETTEVAAAEDSADEESDNTFTTGVEEHLGFYRVLILVSLLFGSVFGFASLRLKKAARRELWDVNGKR